MWLIYNFEDLELAELHSKTLRCNQQSEKGSRTSGFYKWFPQSSLIYCPKHSWTYSVCGSNGGEVQGVLEELCEHRPTNYISKNNNPKSTKILSFSEESIYAVFSQYKPSQALEVLPFDPTIPTGKSICNDCSGSEVTWILGSEVLVETCKAHFSFYLFKHWQLQK